MRPAFSLSGPQRKALFHHYRRNPDPALRQRAHILLLLDDGLSFRQVRRVTYVSYCRISACVRRCREGGVEAVLRRLPSSRPRWSDEAGAILQQALRGSPGEWGYRSVNWTVPLLREHIEKQWGQRPSDREVRQQLRQLDYVWKRPRHALRESKSPRVMRRLRAIRERVKDLPAGVAKLFEDETDLHLFPPLRAGWFLRGKPAEVPISGENAKRTVFGTIDVETGQRIFASRDGACGPDFEVILRLIRRGYGQRRVALLLDGASRHSARYSERLASDLGIELIYLPARCANVNPMDRLWKWGKDKICANKQYLSIDYQAEAFTGYLLGLSPQEALRKAGILSGNFWLFR